MSKVAVVGCGGIGSFFIQTLDKLIEGDQLDGFEFECFDDDVVEMKNILYQNFVAGDVDDYKTEALSYRYLNIRKYTTERVTSKFLNKFDLVILCADNNVIRRDAWKNWIDFKIPFIDARSNGTTVGIFSNQTEGYLDGLTDTTESFSCQYPHQLANKEIEIGNMIIANILAQQVLNYKRNKGLPADFIYNF